VNNPAYLSTDAGLLPIGQLDQSLGLTQQLAEALSDRHQGPALKHSFQEMTRMRVYGILAGYEDQNDHDALRRAMVTNRPGTPRRHRDVGGKGAYAPRPTLCLTWELPRHLSTPDTTNRSPK